MSKEVVIFIPTYKNRFDKILNYANELCKQYDVFIVFSNNDENLLAYDVYNWDDRITKLFSDAKNIGEKHQFIVDYAYENGYRYAIQMDDDIEDYAYEINDDSKRTTSNSYRRVKIKLEKLIDEMIKVAKEYDAAYVSPTLKHYMTFNWPGRLFINHRVNTGQFTMVDVKQLNELCLKYVTNKDEHDDVILVWELIRNGKTCISLGYMAFDIIYASKKNAIVSTQDNNFKMDINLYLRYRDLISIFMNKRGNLFIKSNMLAAFNNKEIIIKNDEYHKRLYELCKAYDEAGIKKLIMEKYKLIYDEKKKQYIRRRKI